MLHCNALIQRSRPIRCYVVDMTSITLKRLLVVVVSLVAMSAAFAIGYSTDLQAIERAPHAMAVVSSWLTGAMSGDAGTAWNVAGAIAIMAVIAKRGGKA